MPKPMHVINLVDEAYQRRIGRRIDDVLAHIWPSHHENIHFYGTHTADIDRELAELDTDGYRPLRVSQPPDQDERLSPNNRACAVMRAVGRAVVARPSVVFADEPTGALDSANGDVVLDLLLEQCAEVGALLVMVTHDATLAAHCHRVVHLRDGIVDESGSVPEGHGFRASGARDAYSGLAAVGHDRDGRRIHRAGP